MKFKLTGLLGLTLLGALCVPQARAANIITFGVNAGSCGGSVMCSTNGTTGYLIDGTGKAFNLSTISQWFQIDPNNSSSNTSENYLPGSQSAGEPDAGAGGFLVVNDTGAAITSFSLTLTDTFTSSTQSVGACKSPGPQAGKVCDNFSAQGQNSWNTELSGADWSDCTSGNTVGSTCQGGPGGVAADFAPNMITYSWSGGSIAAGAKFDITFASWQQNMTSPNGASPGTPGVPEPASIVLLGTIFAIIFFSLRKAIRA